MVRHRMSGRGWLVALTREPLSFDDAGAHRRVEAERRISIGDLSSLPLDELNYVPNYQIGDQSDYEYVNRTHLPAIPVLSDPEAPNALYVEVNRNDSDGKADDWPEADGRTKA